MKNTLSNTPTKIFKSVCTSNVYPRLPMALCLVLCMLGLGLSVNASGTTTTITTFDAPGAGTAAGQGTIAVGNNTPGAITGQFIDGNNVNHAFVRSNQGIFSTFDVPGVGRGAGQCKNGRDWCGMSASAI